MKKISLTNSHFISPSLGEISTERMISEIKNFIENDSENFYRLVIGTDSQVKRLNGVAECDFVTAIIIHRKGSGARYFWRKERVELPPVLREKIYKETLTSLETAQKIVPQLRSKLNGFKYDLEIHVDVGRVGSTREMLREVVGMVTGNGFVVRTKPESWGASSVADKHT